MNSIPEWHFAGNGMAVGCSCLSDRAVILDIGSPASRFFIQPRLLFKRPSLHAQILVMEQVSTQIQF